MVKDRYYTKEEYNALDPEQKKALSLKRAKRGTASSKVKGSKPKSAPVAMSKAVKKLVTRQVAELTKTKKADNDASDASDSTSDTPVTGNRNNKALVRKTKK